MVWVPISSLASKGQPWVGTRFQLADSRSIMIVAGENKKALLDQNGQFIYKLRPSGYVRTVKFLGVSPDGKRILFEDEENNEQDDLPISGGGYFVQRLAGGRRRTRKTRRKSRRARY